MLSYIKQILHLKLTIHDHQELGHKLVSHWGQKETDYNFEWKKYKVVEVCKGDLKGHCWIRRI